MPETICAPSNSEVEIKGTKDGGGGITYALYVPVSGETYFNTAPLNDVNKYTIETLE